MTSVPFILLAVLLGLLGIEAYVIRRAVNRLAIRVHVNGTRGKSAVTRYIAAALRANGRKTLAKITGVVPTIILPDGSSEAIHRRGPANVREQLRMLFRSEKLQSDAIVLECMSVAPLLQSTETEVLRPHLTVLTNILDDHNEELGSTAKEWEESYSSSLPYGAIIVMPPETATVAVRTTAWKRRCSVVTTGETPVQGTLPEQAIRRNVDLALEAAIQLGCDRDVALGAIIREIESEPAPVSEFIGGGTRVRFLNGFAVNDVPSAIVFLELWQNRLGHNGGLVFLLNTRNDRPIRTQKFARWAAGLANLDGIILVGSHVPAARRELLRMGFPDSKIGCWNSADCSLAAQKLAEFVPDGVLAVGFGNIGGDGFTVVENIRHASVNGSATP